MTAVVLYNSISDTDYLNKLFEQSQRFMYKILIMLNKNYDICWHNMTCLDFSQNHIKPITDKHIRISHGIQHHACGMAL